MIHILVGQSKIFFEKFQYERTGLSIFKFQFQLKITRIRSIKKNPVSREGVKNIQREKGSSVFSGGTDHFHL